jgi:hypothetical protein
MKKYIRKTGKIYLPSASIQLKMLLLGRNPDAGDPLVAHRPARTTSLFKLGFSLAETLSSFPSHKPSPPQIPIAIEKASK